MCALYSERMKYCPNDLPVCVYDVCQSTQYVATSAKCCIEKNLLAMRCKPILAFSRAHASKVKLKRKQHVHYGFFWLMPNKLAAVWISSAQHAPIHFDSDN